MAPPMAAVVFACVVFCQFGIVFVLGVTSYRRDVVLLIRGSMPPGIVPIVLTRSTDALDVLVSYEVNPAAVWQEKWLPGLLCRRKLRPPLPGVFLANVNSLPNKMDELRL